MLDGHHAAAGKAAAIATAFATVAKSMGLGWVAVAKSLDDANTGMLEGATRIACVAVADANVAANVVACDDRRQRPDARYEMA